ncbi:unnamed protein product (macronuclear) [Paramecium tetraurelia]|uniref:Uncharacterized protein n=1 Tax=Paramecium tetraurelia TaxID=5888 RepID=A0BRU6_PARTE|nr:uncharacterized protein GSPATT00031494001 [Paramecium tetraurelia]CAK61263.1 unnamed protein product [Paramecium tetraurelia]|eukprot:XP_001428661.1 hypothetical protein (macronuclear) [Paramecium tetraurelia strain d4-2]
MNQYGLSEKLSEEQKRKLHELHLIQQRELGELIRRHQQEQLMIFEQWKKEEQDSHNQSKNFSIKDDKNSIFNYKPYTLSQYKLLKLQPILRNPGQGLGPTLSIEKWQQQKEKMDRMLEFAEHVKAEHRHFKQKISKSQPKEVTVRQKGLEFARNILKPIEPSPMRKKSISKNSVENDELLEYELRNQLLKEQIGKMK